MPWKRNGLAWHTSEKGFPPRKKPKWDLALVQIWIDITRQLEPDIKVDAENQATINLRLPGTTRICVRLKTKQTHALEVSLVCMPGQFNATHFEGISEQIEITTDKANGVGEVSLQFQRLEQLKSAKLPVLLKQCFASCRKLYGTE
jgi:hypothetical protein